MYSWVRDSRPRPSCVLVSVVVSLARLDPESQRRIGKVQILGQRLRTWGGIQTTKGSRPTRTPTFKTTSLETHRWFGRSLLTGTTRTQGLRVHISTQPSLGPLDSITVLPTSLLTLLALAPIITSPYVRRATYRSRPKRGSQTPLNSQHRGRSRTGIAKTSSNHTSTVHINHRSTFLSRTAAPLIEKFIAEAAMCE